MKKNQMIKLIVFGVAAAIIYGIGIFTDVWDNIPKNFSINISWANVLRVLGLVCVVLFVQGLASFLFEKIKSDNKRTNTVISICGNLLKYVAAIVIFCGGLSMLGVNIGTILASLGVLALIIGFGAESLIADVVTGMFILLDNQYNVGDIIEVLLIQAEM